MAHIAAGFSFQDGVVDQVTSAALHTHVDGALVTNIGIAEWDSDSHIEIVNATTPAADQGEGSIWWDTTDTYLRLLADVRWDAVQAGPQLTNNSGYTLEEGHVVKISTGSNNKMEAVDNEADEQVIGVVAGVVEPTGLGDVNRAGIYRVLLYGPVTRGDLIVSSGTVTGAGMAATAVYGNALFTHGVPFAQAFSNVAAAATGLVTCFVFSG